MVAFGGVGDCLHPRQVICEGCLHLPREELAIGDSIGLLVSRSYSHLRCGSCGIHLLDSVCHTD